MGVVLPNFMMSFSLVAALILLVGPVVSDLKIQRINSGSWVLILLSGFVLAFRWTSAEALAFVFSFALLWVGLNFVPDKELALGDKNLIMSLSVLVPTVILPVLSFALVLLQTTTLLLKKPVPFVPLLWVSLCFAFIL